METIKPLQQEDVARSPTGRDLDPKSHPTAPSAKSPPGLESSKPTGSSKIVATSRLIEPPTFGAESVDAQAGAEGSATQLLGEALRDARRLVEVEVALARDEIRREVREAKVAGASFGFAAVVSIIALTMFVVAIAMAFSSAGLASLIIGGILMGLAGLAALVGIVIAPRSPLGRTRTRLQADIRAVNVKKKAGDQSP